MRNWGIADGLSSLPDWVHTISAALTIAGDPLVVLGVVTIAYWVGPRLGLLEASTGARLAATALVGVAFVAPAKAFIAAPRPPSSIATIAADGYGVPSGHTTAAASLATGAVLLLNENERRLRFALAGGYVTIVAATRLILGVHYFGDVLTGVIAGVVCAMLAVTLSARHVGFAFGLGAMFGIAGALITGLTPEAMMAADAARGLGGTVGALVAWLLLDRMSLSHETPGIRSLGIGGTIAVAGLAVGLVGPPLLVAIGTGITGAVVVIVPRLRW